MNLTFNGMRADSREIIAQNSLTTLKQSESKVLSPMRQT